MAERELMKRERHPRIVIEGLDGAGKTTLGHGLAKVLGCTPVESPPQPFARLRHANLRGTPARARFAFYLAGNLQTSTALAQPPGPMVVVRYVWSTLAYHAVAEDLSLRSTWELAQPLLEGITMPDLVIHLYAESSTRLSRVIARGGESRSDLQKAADARHQAALDSAMRESFSVLPASLISIDTTDRQGDDTLNMVISSLGALGAA